MGGLIVVIMRSRPGESDPLVLLYSLSPFRHAFDRYRKYVRFVQEASNIEIKGGGRQVCDIEGRCEGGRYGETIKFDTCLFDALQEYDGQIDFRTERCNRGRLVEFTGGATS